MRRACLRLAVGDITQWHAHAIAISSNATLTANDRPAYWRFDRYRGTNGAAHAAAGPELLAACHRLPERHQAEQEGTKCAVGQAVVTPSFGRLAETCRHVVHPTSCPHY